MEQTGKTKQGKRPLTQSVVDNEKFPVHFAGRLHVQL